MRPLRSQLEKIYGPIVNGVWNEQVIWGVTLTLPSWLQPVWKFGHQPTYHIIVNKDMVDPLQKAWNNIRDRGCLNSISSYDGCLEVRQSRVDQRPSVHSWALAIDLNAARNVLGTKGNQDPVLVGCFTDAGFCWGGSWKYPDPMHLEYVTED